MCTLYQAIGLSKPIIIWIRKNDKKRENIADTMIKDNLLFCPNPQTHANFNVHKGPHTFVSVIPKIQWTKTANCYLTGTQTKKRVVKKFTAIHEKKKHERLIKTDTQLNQQQQQPGFRACFCCRFSVFLQLQHQRVIIFMMCDYFMCVWHIYKRLKCSYR